MAPISKIIVKTVPFDSYIENERFRRIDFAKIGAEGTELKILTGVQNSFGKKFGPVIMIEAGDLGTRQWNYSASAIHEKLAVQGYCWSTTERDGQLRPHQNSTAQYNFVAVPEEKLDQLQEFIKPVEQASWRKERITRSHCSICRVFG